MDSAENVVVPLENDVSEKGEKPEIQVPEADGKSSLIPIRAPVSEEVEDAGDGEQSSESGSSDFENAGEHVNGDSMEPEFQDAIPETDDMRSLMPIRAPVSEEVEDGGQSSSVSEDSFDSALERIAASSTASSDTFTEAGVVEAPADTEKAEEERVLMPIRAPVSEEIEDERNPKQNSSSSDVNAPIEAAVVTKDADELVKDAGELGKHEDENGEDVVTNSPEASEHEIAAVDDDVVEEVSDEVADEKQAAAAGESVTAEAEVDDDVADDAADDLDDADVADEEHSDESSPEPSPAILEAKDDVVNGGDAVVEDKANEVHATQLDDTTRPEETEDEGHSMSSPEPNILIQERNIPIQEIPADRKEEIGTHEAEIEIKKPEATTAEPQQASDVADVAAVKNVSADAAPVEDVSADAAAVEDVSADAAAVEDVSADAAAVEDVSADAAAVEDVSADAAAVEDVSADAATVDVSADVAAVESEDVEAPVVSNEVSNEVNGKEKEEEKVEEKKEERKEEEETEESDVQEEDDDDDEEQRNEALEALVRASAAAAASEGRSMGSAGPSLPARPTSHGRPAQTPDATSRPAASTSASAVTTVAANNPTTVTTVAAATTTPSSSVAATATAAAEANDPADENNVTREKLQMIRVKFLRLAQRLGQSAQNVVVAQVLYRLGLAEQLRGGRSSSRNSAFSFDRASTIAEEQEAAGSEELDFTCTIMVLGKTGVGKSATINSLFDEVKTETNAFAFATKKVQEITGTVHGIKLRVIDTPGLLSSVADQKHNERIMSSVKRFIKKSPPDIVLYFDRLDMQSRDYGDLPLLRTITDTFGAAIWFNAIVVLTHASSAPPDGPNGMPLSYEMFLSQRSHVVQQTIRQAAGDMRLMNPVSLVENHRACRRNRNGERVLPNGQVWKPQLLLLCFASKILAEANSLLKLQESTPGKPFGMRSKVPPLPFLLSSLLQSRAPLKLPDENAGDEEEDDEDLEEVEDSDDDEEYDELPPFRRLTKDELGQLDKKNRDAYYEELRLREKLFQKKQWKEELKRRREFKKKSKEDGGGGGSGYGGEMDDGYDDGNDSKSAAVPVALPDMALPPSFDSDNPTHRYRYLETATQWMVRPVLEAHGWDHDSGYDGLNVEKGFVVANKIPASISGQLTKDKKEASVTMETAASVKLGEGKVTQLGFDMQSVGKDMSYTLRNETRFSNWKKNKTIIGTALTMLGETLAFGLKIEDRLMIGKRLKVVMNGGALTGKGEAAYGGTMEMSLRDKDFPVGRNVTSLGVSVMNWHGDVAIGGNVQSQVMIGRSMVVVRGNLNNRGTGQIMIKANSSEQLQMALLAIIPLVRAIVGHKIFNKDNNQI